MRHDFIPIHQCEALSSLLDEVKPFPTTKARKMIRKELGRPVEELYAEFSSAPIASASFSQVYKAKNFEGETLAVKVKRPICGSSWMQISSFCKSPESY